MSIHELVKQARERVHTPAPARSELSQQKCACGGTPGPDGECAACKAKRLRAESAGQLSPSSPLPSSTIPRGGFSIERIPIREKETATDNARASRWVGAVSKNRPPNAPPVPSNTVHCVQKWNPCSAPYSPGTWAAKVTYHCPVWPGLPGTTETSYVTIPDEFIGPDSTGRDMYRCRPGFQVRIWTDIADTVAATLNRQLLYPDFTSCHAGFRTLLTSALESLFAPSGGGRPAGIRVNAPPPPSGIPCP
jgi:hypothetical protein